jgi:pilus assembly protein CpaC
MLAPILHCNGDIEQRDALEIGLGQSTTFGIDDVIRTRSVGNPGIVQSIQTGPSQLYLVGTRIGSTNMVIQGRRGACSAVSVTVSADTIGLQQALAKLMPEETDVHVHAASDALILSGQVSDATQAQRIVELAQRFVTAANSPVSNTPPTDGKAPSAPSPSDKADERVINMLTVAAPQQVMLEVKVAEVSKKLADQLNLDVAMASSHLSGAISTLFTFGKVADGFTLDAKKSDQPVKILAEPNLMAISGQKANFLAGGKVFIPVPQSFGAGTAMITLQEETYGVKLTFMPTVLRNGVINLQVSPEVSDLSGDGLSNDYGKNSSQPIPIFDIRSASTTVQLKDGQSFAIGGLLKDNVRGQLDALPGLGELPVLGALFRSTQYQSEKTELVFIVTPHLVKPLPTNYPLPTDTFGKVDRWNMLATGNMEATPVPQKQSATSDSESNKTSVPPSDGDAAGPIAPLDHPVPGQHGESGDSEAEGAKASLPAAQQPAGLDGSSDSKPTVAEPAAQQ